VTAEIVLPPKQVSRRRWWIHLILIGGYFAAAIPFTLSQAPRRPTLMASTRGLLFVCAWEVLIFAIVFGLGWFVSRASADSLLLRWRQGWWTAPLGVGYSIAMRIAVGIILFIIVAILLATGLLNRESVAGFSDSRSAVERLVDLRRCNMTEPIFG
jgi:hypothetical protein